MIRVAFQLEADEMRELRFLAKSRRMTLAELVRHMARGARGGRASGQVSPKVAVVEKKAKRKSVH